jgi:putative spermidine/putrescine transport system ATP-binding protein
VFDHGRLMQVGTPEEIYRRPNSRFVADFVGSSNVLAPDFVQTVVGERRWASLRPEAIHVVRAGSGLSTLSGKVVSRSYLGATTRLGIDLKGTVLHAVIPSADDNPTEGETVTLGFAKDALHLMEAEG